VNALKYAVVTTFHKQGYELYGKRMIQTFIKNWPQEVTLYVYHEGVIPTEVAPNLVLRDLESSSIELIKFKTKWKNVPKANGNVSDSTSSETNKNDKVGFKWDAVRFSHKVYAIFHCAKNCDADVLFWMDADTVCHSPINLHFITSMAHRDMDLGYLGRKNKYTECGLYSMNLKSVSVQKFLNEFQRMYDDAENGIFTLKEWHDSFVFDDVRRRITGLREYNWSNGIIDGEGHPLINCEWGRFLDHLKGKRKQLRKSKQKDLKTPRQEKYWINS
jgi:hypothetical protein